MKKLLNMLSLDLKLILQDKIALYMALAPALLSFIFLAVIGNMSEGTLKLAITRNVPQEIVERLETVADIEIYDDYDVLQNRVQRADSIAGVYMDGETLSVLVEGNEKVGFADKNALLIDRALSENVTEYQSIGIESTENQVLTIAIASILLLGIMIAGAVSGFNIVNERESGVIRALAVSPTGLVSYIGIRSFTAMVLAIINVAISTIIMGKAGFALQMVYVALASIFMYAIIAVLLGSFADNLISSFAMMKVIMPVFLIIPVVSAFIPDKFHVLFYPLPMYWQYDSIVKVLAGGNAVFSLLMILATGAFWFTVVFLLRSKVFILRIEGLRKVSSGLATK